MLKSTSAFGPLGVMYTPTALGVVVTYGVGANTNANLLDKRISNSPKTLSLFAGFK